MREFLHADGLDCRIDRVWARDSFSAALDGDHPYDVIIADHQLPNFDGHAALAIAHAVSPHTPFIFVSGTLGEELAVEALKHGATDYVVKQRLERLPSVVQRALAEAVEKSGRQAAQAALRTSEENFAAIVDTMPQLCWMADADGRMIWFNRRWYDYTGTSPAQMAEPGAGVVHHIEELEDVQRQWRHSVETGNSFEMLLSLKGADGRYRKFLTRAQPARDEDGRVVRWFGTNTDVSAQYEAEEALRRLNETLEQRVVETIAERQKMAAHLNEAQRLETIGQLTGGVAHDFNNLLTPILGSLEVLRRTVGDNDRALRLISAALQAAERAKTLVQRLLAFGRRQVLDLRAVDIATLVDGMRELMERSLGPQITLNISCEPDLAAARVDPSQLELALLNLAVNARDAMPGGGTLSIDVGAGTVGPEHPGDMRHGDYIRITVSDTGTGMDETTLSRAVEPFYSTKGVGRGTGLGLSMVHGLAAQSGGALLLSSQVGVGTVAEMWLPLANEQAEEPQQLSFEQAGKVRPTRILLVDDEAIVRAATGAMLSDLGHKVIEAGSGAQALELLRDGVAPELVITDYLMPGMNGAELAKEIRAAHPNLPIMIATGYAAVAGNAMADLPLLPKPFRQSELAATIERLISSALHGEGARKPKLRLVKDQEHSGAKPI